MSVLFSKEIHDSLIFYQVNEHYNEALTLFPESRIVGIFCQGSQNYGLDYENSDLDTKLIVLPTFEDIAFNRKPISTTHIRANNEHIDMKDIRLYMNTFVKQNLNFLEILFTNYKIVNPMYKKQWDILEENRELIAHMNPYRAVKSMYGIAMEKYHAMEHPYPSKLAVLAQWQYDPKQLHHLLRVEEYLARYITGVAYIDCLHPANPSYLIDIKRGLYNLDEARTIANSAKEHITQMMEDFCSTHKDEINPDAQKILDEVQYNIMKIAIADEFKYDEVYD